MVYFKKTVYVEKGSRYSFEIGDGQYVFLRYFYLNDPIWVYENEVFLYTIPQSELENEIAKWVFQYTESFDFQYSTNFFGLLESIEGWTNLECEIANRVLFKQRVFTRELVNLYVVSLKENFFNPYDLDFVNVYYIVDRTADFRDLIGKDWKEISEVAKDIKENILLYKKKENGSQKGVWIIYNKALYKTVYDKSNTEGVVQRVFQIWDIEEVNDIVKRFDESLEGTIIFNNIDNEIVLR